MTRTRQCSLNPKQRAFCREYLVDFNASQAAIRAGYSKKTASQIGYALLRNIQVQAEITKLVDERDKETGLTAEWIISRLMEVTERSMQHVPVLDAKGEPTGEYTFQAAGANQALGLLGKHKRLFGDTPAETEDTRLEVTDSKTHELLQRIADSIGVDVPQVKPVGQARGKVNGRGDEAR